MEVENNNPLTNEIKEYQTLFWVPMLFQTVKTTENLIEEMLTTIQEFHEHNNLTGFSRRSSIQEGKRLPSAPKRRQQILGDAHEADLTVTTQVDVVIKSDSTKFTLLSVLKRHFLFSQLRDYELEDVIDVMQSQYINEGDVIIQQGDHGELFYILEEGTCEIVINSESLGYIESGSSFGDLALMYNCPRAATIKAVTDCSLWTLDRVFFRQAMVTSSSNQNDQLSQFLSKINLFASLGIQQLNQLARSLTKQTYEDKHYIIKQGDIGEQFYVIYKGKVIVSKTDDSGQEHVLIELGEGEVFGERALIKKEPRKANVITNGPVECYYLESQDFYSMLGEFVEKFNKMNEFRIIRSAKVFSKLSDVRLKEFITQFVLHRMFSGQRHVCGIDEITITIDGQFMSNNGEKYGSDGVVEVGGLDYSADIVAGALTAISEEGTLGSFTKEQLQEMIRKSEEDEQRRAKRGSYLDNAKRSQLDGNGSMLLTQRTDSQLSANDTVVDVEKEIQAMAERRRLTAQSRRQSLAPFFCTSLHDLELLSPLGKGTFGSVFLCEHKRTKKTMALKCLDKKAVVEGGQHNYINREVHALQVFQHPFLSTYYGLLVSPRKICFLLEYIPGGELWSYLYDNHAHVDRPLGEFGGLKVASAALYAANVILALEHIHELGYTYRDLKPENLMIHSNGYLKIVDFGFAKQVPYINKQSQIQYRTFTLCGTPDYMAPYVISFLFIDKFIC